MRGRVSRAGAAGYERCAAERGPLPASVSVGAVSWHPDIGTQTTARPCETALFEEDGAAFARWYRSCASGR
ncbi:hypothetical protein GGP62_001842 [Salinibacter ruber]|uniref:Uncharacterized protein n=1 Tax=Salinibacter ruber TaxID=146919 RepID=A0A9X2Q6C8_9BACT|nr:hypothetical protein [Salinibacter ruber]MCS3659701.1 hypothetical protein [Salinibacter ruber]MCS3706943.1 hypothetical protein [Salinibacter ruber]MCS3709460.1 hypothetical protein [Salinibacter ruber]MCS3821802.1 hypothetical protein [Salinibacter ruber]